MYKVVLINKFGKETKIAGNLSYENAVKKEKLFKDQFMSTEGFVKVKKDENKVKYEI